VPSGTYGQSIMRRDRTMGMEKGTKLREKKQQGKAERDYVGLSDNKTVGLRLEFNSPYRDPSMDEISILKQARETEDVKLKWELQNKVITNNFGLVFYILRRFGTFPGIQTMLNEYRITYGDLFADGYFGLIKAVRSFNPDKGYKLATLASRCIMNEILLCMRRLKKARLSMSLDTPINKDVDGHELLLADLLSDDEDFVEEMAHIEFRADYLRRLDRFLTDKEMNLIKLYFFSEEEYTMVEIGQMLGISQSYVSRRIKRTLEKARKLAVREGLI
jgi:RNA polymerase sporulation-specific sigma factor